ncbi:MAG: hypothetical protein ABI224_14510 [Acetobacteraceae bacterium]
MPVLVLDASVALGFLLPDEASPAADEILSQVTSGAAVPGTWPALPLATFDKALRRAAEAAGAALLNPPA